MSATEIDDKLQPVQRILTHLLSKKERTLTEKELKAIEAAKEALEEARFGLLMMFT